MIVFERCIEQQEQFSGDGSQSDLGGFSSSPEAFVDGRQSGVRARGGKAAQVKHASHIATPSADVSLATAEDAELRHAYAQGQRSAPADALCLPQTRSNGCE